MIQIFQLAVNPVCAPYRLEFPAKLLNRTGEFRVTTFRNLNAEAYLQLLDQADMFVIQRLPLTSRLKRVIAALNQHGIPVIYEIDDDLMNLPEGSRYAQTAPPDYAQRIREGIQTCQAVQCSTSALRNRLQPLHSEIAVLENQLPAIPEFIEKPISNGRPLIIALPLGENHGVDWAPVADAFSEILTRLKKEGWSLEIWVLGDTEIFDSIQTDRKRYFPLLARDQYLKVLKSADLAIIPLAELPFNHAKSDVKFLECAAASTAVLASNLVYERTVRHNETGLLFESADTLKTSLQKILDNPALIPKLAHAAHRYVAGNRLLPQHIDTWQQTYRRWYKQRKKLMQNGPLSSANFLAEASESAGHNQ